MVKLQQREGRLCVTVHAGKKEDVFLKVSLGSQNGGLFVLPSPHNHMC